MKRINAPADPRVGVLCFLGLFFFLNDAIAGVPISVDACRRISEAGKTTNTKALIIGYEGLFSSSPINANLLASYRDKLAHGQSAKRPLFLFGGSFLTRGPLVRIVEAYKNKVQVLVFGRTLNEGMDSIPAQCAKIWKENASDRKVIIVGHSFGGGAAWKLSRSLEKMGVSVDGVVTADPRSPSQCLGECWNWAKPANVVRWESCYQSIPLRGHPVPGAYNHFQGPIGHASVQNTPCVFNGITRILDGVGGSLTVDPLKYSGEESKNGRGGTFQSGSSISGGIGSAPSLNATAGRKSSIFPAFFRKPPFILAAGGSAGSFGAGEKRNLGLAMVGSSSPGEKGNAAIGNESRSSDDGSSNDKRDLARNSDLSLSANFRSKLGIADSDRSATEKRKNGFEESATLRGRIPMARTTATSVIGELGLTKRDADIEARMNSDARGITPGRQNLSQDASSQMVEAEEGSNLELPERAESNAPLQDSLNPESSIFVRVHRKLEQFKPTPSGHSMAQGKGLRI